MRVKITELSKSDCFYNSGYVGKIGTGNIVDWEDGWSYCDPFTFEDGEETTLYEFKYIEVPEPVKLLPCWKCGNEQPIYVKESGSASIDSLGNPIVTNYVSCFASCMPRSEKYTIDEWQNHPRSEPSAMSELGVTVNKYTTDPVLAIKFAAIAVSKAVGYTVEAAKEEDKFNKAFDNFNKVVYPKKLTWIQKIRGYDDLASKLKVETITRKMYANGEHDALCRARSSEAMLDHYKAVCKTQREVIKDRTRDVNYYKSIATEKARELELMEKVADNWQQKAIDANKMSDCLGTYLDMYDILGKRLKFSVGHNHITITIGNPITLCENFETQDIKARISGSAISRCSTKDIYDWKKGVIQSLDNLCDEKKYTQKLRRDLRKALAKKYPEVFCDRTPTSD